MNDIIPGGKADNKDPRDFKPADLLKGIEEEKEHTSSNDIASEISMDHLSEDPKYYDKLEKMEKSAFWQGFSKKEAASLGIKNWLAKLKKSKGGVDGFLRRANLKGFSSKGIKSTAAGRSIR